MRGSGGTTTFAIVRVDIVASSQTLANSGIGAAVEERALLAAVAESCSAGSGGFVVAVEGDGLVMAFRSTLDAFAASSALQAEVVEAADLAIRVGITLGDLRFDDAGEVAVGALPALRRAADVEQQAVPNQVLVDDLAARCRLGVSQPALVEVATAAPNLGGPMRALARGDVGSGEHAAGATELRAVMFTRFEAEAHQLASLMRTGGEAVEACGGQILDTHGPGHVVHFRSCADALMAATGVHEAVASAALAVEGSAGASVSVAISTGEVAIDSDDNFGPPVLEAARLLDHTDGTVVFTDAVHRIADLTVDGEATSSLLSLKGVPEPVLVHTVSPAVAAPPLLDLPRALATTPRFDFAGRDADLAYLRSAWRDAIDGNARCVVISGEEGAGKTRLTRELAVTAHGDGAIVLFGACDEDVQTPYSPLSQAFAAASDADAELFEGASGQGPLAPLFLDGGSSTPRANQHAFLDSVVAAAKRLSDRRPVLIVADDVQWASADAFGLLERLLSHPGLGRVLVVATCRSGALDQLHPLQKLLASSRTVRPVSHRRLDRLSVADVAHMLSSRAGATDPADIDAFADEVTKITGGSPLFVEELVVHLIATGALVGEQQWSLAADLDTVSMPESLVDLMERRVSRLGEMAVATLRSAAVMGSSFDLQLLALVSERDLDEVVTIAETAGLAGLIDETEAGRCEFRDELTREALLRSLSPTRRALAHRRVAEIIEARQPDDIDVLAYHWGAALGDDAMLKASEFLQRAARRDMHSLAWETAVGRLERVLELRDQVAAESQHDLGQLRYELGYCRRMLGDDAYLADLAEAASAARSARDGVLLANVAMAMMRPGAWYPEAGIVDEDICNMCDDALLLLGPDDPLRARLMAVIAINLAYDPDRTRCIALVEESQRLARESGDLHLIGTTLAAELVAFQAPDGFDRRWEIAQEARRIGRATNDVELIFTGGFFMLLELVERGDFDEAGVLAQELKDLAEQMRAYFPQYLISHFPTFLAIARCDPQAAELIEADRVRFDDYPVDSFSMSVIQTAVIAMGAGTASEMLLPLAEAVDLYSDNAEWTARWNYAFARTYLDLGDLEAAHRAIEAYPNPPLDRYWMSSIYHLGVIGLTLGRDDYCQRVLDELGQFRGRFAMIGVGAALTGQVSTALGQASLGLRRLHDAEAFLREAVDQAVALGFPYFATTARRYLAMTLLEQDPTNAEAAELLSLVIDGAQQCGFGIELREAEALVSRCQ